MKQTFLAFVCLMIAATLTAQTIDNHVSSSTNHIEMKKVIGGYKYLSNGKTLKFKELENILQSNELAYSQIKSSKSSRTIATILGAAGGFMIGWPIGTAIGGGDANWTLAAIGAGAAAASIPFSISANKKIKTSVHTYNSGYNTSSLNKTELNLQISGSGVGLALKF